MDSLFILIPIALVFVAIAIRAFIWAVNNRQYDDLDKAANSILFDDVEVKVNPRTQGAAESNQSPSSDCGTAQSRVVNE